MVSGRRSGSRPVKSHFKLKGKQTAAMAGVAVAGPPESRSKASRTEMNAARVLGGSLLRRHGFVAASIGWSWWRGVSVQRMIERAAVTGGAAWLVRSIDTPLAPIFQGATGNPAMDEDLEILAYSVIGQGLVNRFRGRSFVSGMIDLVPPVLIKTGVEATGIADALPF